MLFALLAAAAVQAQAVPPPPTPAPVRFTQVVAPPAPVIEAAESGSRPPLLLFVSVSGNGQSLWEGTLRVGVQGATFSQEIRQSGELPPSCERGRAALDHYSLTVRLNRLSRLEERDAVQVAVNWTRSIDAPSCGLFEAPARTVGLTDIASLESGKTVQLNGDGGLTVRLRLQGR